MKEFFGNLNSADTTCWIDCECGVEDIFVSDSLVRCPKCGRGYKVNFTVTQYEPQEDPDKALPTLKIETLVAKTLWPDIDLATIKVLQVPLGTNWASIPRVEHFDHIVNEHVPLHEILLKLHLGYEPKTNIVVVTETQLIGVKGDL